MEPLFKERGFDKKAELLDCACGIGTQSIGLAERGYHVTASDISEGELAEARRRAAEAKVKIRFEKADFCALDKIFTEQFDIILAMDNALPHMLSKETLEKAVRSIAGRMKPGGIFVGSIRDYDAFSEEKPSYSPPYIHKTEQGQRVSFQTWEWDGDCYKLVQYIIEDQENLKINKFECIYRATCRKELTELFHLNGCDEVEWIFPEESGFYQPIIIANKKVRHH